MNTRPLRILVVEDQQTTSLILCAGLERHALAMGVEVRLERALTVARALQVLDDPERRPDVILLDLVVGEDRGEDVLERARATEPRVRVIVLSGLQEEWDGERLVSLWDLKPDAVLGKPTPPARVAELIFGSRP